MLGVCVGHVTWTVRGARGVISLPRAKVAQRTGSPESSTFDDLLVGAVLEFVLRGRAPHERIWRRSALDFRQVWRKHIERTGMSGEDFLPYCLRRGGATHHFVETGDLSSTRHKGRWLSYKACRVYVVEGQRELQEAALAPHIRAASAAAAVHLERLLRTSTS